jgi:endonuclease/exonuclease/phosphatase family metal-dependent hydrolase
MMLDYWYLIPHDFIQDGFFTRSVLYAKCIVYDDTIHLFINHWPSRRGGVLAGEPYRLKIAEMVRNKADSIISVSNGDARIIIMGDFNSTPDDKAINILTGENIPGLTMINLSENLKPGTGTYRYMGTWEMIDQVIVSDNLINCTEGLYTEPGMLRIFRPDFLLKNDQKYPGLSPYPTYSGFRYQGGYSDHLPVLLDLKIR